MQEKVSVLEQKINQIEREQERTGDTLVQIHKTLDKIADNQEKLILIEQNQTKLEHEIQLMKNELEHRSDMYEGKLKGVRELSDKEDNQIKKDIEDIKMSLKDIASSNKNRDWALIMAMASAIGGLIFSLITGSK